MIPYVMDESKTLAEIVADTSNGLGRLAECSSLFVTEALDGQYTATMVIPVAAYNSGLVHRNGIIKLKANGRDDPQLFRVVTFKETLSSGLIECELEHISYDLNKAVLSTKDQGLIPFIDFAQVCDILNNNNTNGEFFPQGIWTFTTDSGETRYNHGWNKPMTPRQLFYAEDGICNWSGAQIKWDNLTVGINARRGEDKRNSVIITYGKNLADFSQEEDISEIYDGVLGYCYQSAWARGISGDVVPLVTGTTPQHILIVDLSSKGEEMETAPSQATVTNWTQTWLSENTIDELKVAYQVDLVSLASDGEYDKVKQLEYIELGDTVTVKAKGTALSAVVTEVTFDSLTERYTEIKLGNYQPSLTNTIIDLVNKTVG